MYKRQTDINNFQTQLIAQQTQLEQVFSAVNATLEQYPFTLQEVNAALGVLNASSLTSGASSGLTTNTNSTPTSGQLFNSGS